MCFIMSSRIESSNRNSNKMFQKLETRVAQKGQARANPSPQCLPTRADEIDHLGHHQQPPQQQQLGGSSGGGETAQPGPGLREFLLLDYASCLMSHR